MAVVSTIYTYELDGSRRDFLIPFEYLARRFIVITLIGTDRRELVITDEYRFISRGTVQTNKAWGPADGYERIEVRRLTSASERLVDFADGSILRAYELNISQIQTLHVAEEARNMVADTIGTNNDGDLDARGRRLVNLADAIEPDHAITLRQTTGWAGSALNSANAARVSETNSKASENAAKASEQKALGSEQASLVSEQKAATSEANSKASEVAGKASEVAAKASESSSKASEVAAKESEVAAKASEQSAQGWAASVNLPSAEGQAGKMLRQKADGSGFEYTEDYRAFGLGSTNRMLVGGTDLDTLRATGFYFGGSLVNAPDPDNWFYITHQEHGGDGYRTQNAVLLVTGVYQAWGRTANKGVWGSWWPVLTPANLPVSVMGAGLIAAADAAAARAVIGAAPSTIPVTRAFTSPELVVTPGAYYSLAHGLGKKPKLYQAEWKFLNAEVGYMAGATTPIPVGATDGGSHNGFGITSDAAYTYIRWGASGYGPLVLDLNTGIVTWTAVGAGRLIISAFA